MRSPAALFVALVLVCLLVGAAPGSVTDTAAAQTPSEAPPPMSMRIELQPDGDAVWIVRLGFDLETANETVAFDRLADEYAAGRTDLLEIEPFETAAARAAAEIGRPMEVRNASRAVYWIGDRGVLELRFTWTAFADRTSDRLELGDAFRTGSGSWLPRLSAGQSLTIEFPPGFAAQSLSHPLRNGTFTFEGPLTFEPGEPSATLVRQEGPLSPTPTPPDPLGGLDAVSILGVVVALVVLGAIAYLALSRLSWTGDEPAGTRPDAPGGDDGDGGGGESVELLSDEERVLRLLAEHDGRMKQATIVDRTDWSNAKVSQLLTEMAEADKVEKLRIGRENLISLPDGEE